MIKIRFTGFLTLFLFLIFLSFPAIVFSEIPEISEYTFVDGLDESASEEQEEQQEELFNDALENEYDVFQIDSENAAFIEAEDSAAKEMLSQIESGEVIGFAPLPTDVIQNITDQPSEKAITSNGKVITLSTDQYYMEVGARIYCDEVWTASNEAAAGTANYRNACNYRRIHYIDSSGAEKSAILYCMRATRDAYPEGLLRDEAIQAIQNQTIKKLLYYGYEGPGDLCNEYDPTCDHIDWKQSKNRYVFTHIALSKVYANDTGNATSQEIEHVGINRFIEYIKTQPLPTHKKVQLRVSNEDTWVSSNPANVNMILYRTYQEDMPYIWKQFSNGFQISTLIIVSDLENCNNGIKITRKASDDWQLLYWNDLDDYKNRGVNNPRVLSETGSITLKNDGRFKIVISENITSNQKLTFPVSRKPLNFLMVDAYAQTGNSNLQDMGALVYQGENGTVTLNLNILPRGSLKITKKSSTDEQLLAGAKYDLYAGENLYSGKILRYKKDTLVDSGITNDSGVLRFYDLIPGAYYIKEVEAPVGYLVDSTSYNVTVTSSTVTVVKKNSPDIKRSVSIKKIDSENGQILPDAEFEILEWNAQTQKYETSEYHFVFDPFSELYTSDLLSYTYLNSGKFLIRESKNPEGYEGIFQQEIDITNELDPLLYTAENTREELPLVSIAVNKKILESDIVWAHGNPTFTFVADGVDLKGIPHKYEQTIVFRPDTYKKDAANYAYMQTVFENIPAGTYTVYEKPVMRYYLAELTKVSGIVEVINISEPSYGKSPRESMYANVALDQNNLYAEMTFRNEKARFDGYSHTAYVQNVIPLDLT